MYAVMIEPMNTICFLTDRPESLDLPIDEDVEIDIPPNLNDCPEGAERPQNLLGVARSDPKRYKLFKHHRDIDQTEYQPTDKSFGGVYSKQSWVRFSKQLPLLLEFMATPDDPPSPDVVSDPLDGR